jgi:hypothetical protein
MNPITLFQPPRVRADASIRQAIGEVQPDRATVAIASDYARGVATIGVFRVELTWSPTENQLTALRVEPVATVDVSDESLAAALPRLANQYATADFPVVQ